MGVYNEVKSLPDAVTLNQIIQSIPKEVCLSNSLALLLSLIIHFNNHVDLCSCIHSQPAPLTFNPLPSDLLNRLLRKIIQGQLVQYSSPSYLLPLASGSSLSALFGSFLLLGFTLVLLRLG